MNRLRSDEDGTTLRYLSDGAGGYTLPPGVFRKLTARPSSP